MAPIAVTRSIVDARALGEVIAAEYDLPGPLSCKLISKMLRTQDNEHYLVRVGGTKYVARVYQLGEHLRRQESDYLYELDWLNFLKANDQPVSYPIARRDGGYMGQIDAPEGDRYYALFSFAPGNSMAFDDEDRLLHLGATLPQTGDPFQTSGCPDCNRPFYNEQPSGPFYNYPRPLTATETARAIEEMEVETC